MKIIVIGIGQCGCNIADALYEVNNHSESFFGRRAEILIDGFAINTAKADLRQLRCIADDSVHRVLVGRLETFGHGVGKMNQVAADIFANEYNSIIATIARSKRFYEAEAFLVVASGGGGTGSGGISRIVKELKQESRIAGQQRPVYGMTILPFLHEEEEKNSLAVLNTAVSVSTLYEVADAVILVDNERFVQLDPSLSGKIEAINKRIASTFFDLFCAGEESRRKYIGRKVMEAGDIKECIKGFTTLGLGHIDLSAFRSLRKSLGGSRYLEDFKENEISLASLNDAIQNLCLGCDLSEAGRLGLLICSPKDMITEPVVKSMKLVLSGRSPDALIRMGDYPRRATSVTTTLIAGDLGRVQRVEDLYSRAKVILQNIKELERIKQEQKEQVIRMADGLPKLL